MVRHSGLEIFKWLFIFGRIADARKTIRNQTQYFTLDFRSVSKYHNSIIFSDYGSCELSPCYGHFLLFLLLPTWHLLLPPLSLTLEVFFHQLHVLGFSRFSHRVLPWRRCFFFDLCVVAGLLQFLDFFFPDIWALFFILEYF